MICRESLLGGGVSVGGFKAGKSCLGVADVTMKRNTDCLVERGEKSHRYCDGSAQSPLAVVTHRVCRHDGQERAGMGDAGGWKWA
jgi:hypothetical protein